MDVTTVGGAAAEFVRGRRARGEISAATAVAYEDALRQFTRHIGWSYPVDEVTRDDVEGWVESMYDRGHAPRSVRLRLTALSSLYDWCLERELVVKDPTRHVRKPREPDDEPRALTSAQVSAALRACRTERERLIVLLMCQEFLRRAEASRLRLRDIDPERRCMIVHGKGGHQRLVPVSQQTWDLLVRMHPQWAPSAYAVPSAACGAGAGAGVKPGRIGEIVSQVLHRAGIDESGHSLRHTGATDALDNGATIEEVQELLGHASIVTTRRYTGRRRLEQLRRAAAGRHYGGDLGPEAA